MVRALWYCVACKAALIEGEPACCAGPDLIPISKLAAGDRYTWWSARIRRMTPNRFAQIRGITEDHSRAHRSLRRHILGRGGAYVRSISVALDTDTD